MKRRLPTATLCPSTIPCTPWPVIDSKRSTGARETPRS
jgi:hypothetical protein